MEINRYLKKIYLPKSDSHKGQNGRLLIIGGSHLFHSASLWALEVASRIVDLVHYSSVKENNKIVQDLKEEFRNGIVVPRSEIETYIEEDDCILIGSGMLRVENSKLKAQSSLRQSSGQAKPQFKAQSLKEINRLGDEGMQTYYLTKYLLQKYPHKKWVIDAGALQMLDVEDIPNGAILTPHQKEFEKLISKIPNPKSQIPNKFQIPNDKKFQDASDGGRLSLRGHDSSEVEELVRRFVRQYRCIVLLKGEKDIVASSNKMEIINGGNSGMTKGGTGDVLAGLAAGLYCKNDALTSAVCASYINKKAGEELFKTKGYWFNASDLAERIPETMKRVLL